MQNLFLLVLMGLSLGLRAQVYDYSIGRQTERVDSVSEWLQEWEGLGIKNSGSTGLEQSRDWLVKRYRSFGYTTISLDSFVYNGDTLQNIIIEKAGLQEGHWIIVGAHYDSYPGSLGTNDNGSGVIACMQIAKILRDIPTQFGIRFIHFSAEENGLVGSSHYVQNVLESTDTIHLMLNLDQLGGSVNANNSRIVCERDESPSPSTNNVASERATDTLAQLIRNYTFLDPRIDKAYSSDYIPFQNAGYVITGLYQDSHDPFNHSQYDLLSNMDTEATEEVVRGALAAAMYFARHTLPLGVENARAQDLRVYPNPSTGTVFIKGNVGAYRADIQDIKGRVVKQVSSLDPVLQLTELLPGAYILRIYSEQGQRVQYTRLIIAADLE